MLTVVRPHLRAGGGAEQGQLQGVSVHADAVLAIVEHCRAVALVAQGAVPLVAHLEAVAVVQSGTMGGPFHVTELDLVDALRRLHVHGEFHLEQPVQLMPIHAGDEVQTAAACGQYDILRKEGILNCTFHMHHRPEAAILFDCHIHRFTQGDGL